MFLINTILLTSIIAAIVLICVVILTVILVKKGKKKVKVNEKLILDIITNLGSSSNIKDISVENARLKVSLVNTKLADFDALKELSNSGVFITGNNVKLLFKYDSKLIKNEIEKRL